MLHQQDVGQIFHVSWDTKWFKLYKKNDILEKEEIKLFNYLLGCFLEVHVHDAYSHEKSLLCALVRR
jgi:hypothetical protein